MQINRIRAALAIAVLCFAAADSRADIRIRFARGRSSATVAGKVPAGGRVCYFAGARRGQVLSAEVTSRNGKVQILESGDMTYSYTVEIAGDQSICVDNTGRATVYSLTVSIH